MTAAPTRIERDTFGPIAVPADRLWGAQTQRSLEPFRISNEKMPPALIRVLLIVKRRAARVNAELRLLEANRRPRSSLLRTRCSPASMRTNWGYVTKEQFDAWVRPERMIGPT